MHKHHLAHAAWIGLTLIGSCAAEQEDPGRAAQEEILNASIAGEWQPYSWISGNFDDDAFEELALVSESQRLTYLRWFNVNGAQKTSFGERVWLPVSMDRERAHVAIARAQLDADPRDEIVAAFENSEGALELRWFDGPLWATVPLPPEVSAPRACADGCYPAVVATNLDREGQSEIVLAYRSAARDRIVVLALDGNNRSTLATVSDREYSTGCRGQAINRRGGNHAACLPALGAGPLLGDGSAQAVVAYEDVDGSVRVHAFRSTALEEVGALRLPTGRARREMTWSPGVAMLSGDRSSGIPVDRVAVTYDRGDRLGRPYLSMLQLRRPSPATPPGLEVYPIEGNVVGHDRVEQSVRRGHELLEINLDGDSVEDLYVFSVAPTKVYLGVFEPRYGAPGAWTNLRRGIADSDFPSFVVAGNFSGDARDEIATLPWADPTPSPSIPANARNGSITLTLTRRGRIPMYDGAIAPSAPVRIQQVTLINAGAETPGCPLYLSAADGGIFGVVRRGVAERGSFVDRNPQGTWNGIFACSNLLPERVTVRIDWSR